MPRYLTAEHASTIVTRATCPSDYVMNEFIEQAEFIIKTYSSKGLTNTVYSLPLFTSMPIQQINSMQNHLVRHFVDQGFQVEIKRPGELFISWEKFHFNAMRSRRTAFNTNRQQMKSI